MTGQSKRRYAARMPPEERRTQLLDAALRLILAGGYGGVSMEAVAREAGVTKPVVYDAFGNRGELLRALLEREEQRAFAVLGEAIPESATGSPDELFVEGVGAFLSAVAANPDPWSLILLPAEGTPEVVREHVDAGRRAIAAQVEQLVAWGMGELGMPEDTDTELVAQAIIALGEHMARLVITDPERFPPDRWRAFVAGGMGWLPRGAGGTA